MRLYLIRHAQSTNNALPDQRQRTYDPELTELGVKQAEYLAQHLATQPEMPTGHFGNERHADDQLYRFTHLYCSPMIRALETARPIAGALGLVPEVWKDIHEIGGIFLEADDGTVTPFSGATRAEIEGRFPGYTLPGNITPDGWWGGAARGKENTAEYMSRAALVAWQLKERAQKHDHHYEHIALVTHGAFMDALIKGLLNLLPGNRPFDLYFAHYNTAMTRFDFGDGPDGMRLHYLNRTEHLPYDLRSW